jgi:hypothetical protein
METLEKSKHLQAVLSEINENYGKVTVVNNARLIEIYGNQPSERVVFTLIAIATVQKAGGICAFIDVNNNLDIDFVKKLGVDVENLIMSKPNSNEALEIADNLLRSGAIDVVVINSTSDLSTKEITYRLEFNEKQQQFHLDNGTHEENTIGWVTIAEKCTDLEHKIFMRLMDTIFENEKLNKRKCLRCYNATYALMKII